MPPEHRISPPQALVATEGYGAKARSDLIESSSRFSALIEHDLRANAFRGCREGKPLHTFPDHALAACVAYRNQHRKPFRSRTKRLNLLSVRVSSRREYGWFSKIRPGPAGRRRAWSL
jgi:hypothetical protein